MIPSSLPHRGPHAVFIADELRRIRGCVFGALYVGQIDVDIVAKVDVALSSDPKFRTPTP